MYLPEESKLEKQMETLPEGFELVTSGKIQEGDLRWNCYEDCWNTADITHSPKHDIILGDSIGNFHGVCRKIAVNKSQLQQAS